MSQESATEPRNLDQLCLMQEQLLQRCLPVLEELVETSIPTPLQLCVAQELLDDLHAHVDPDVPPPADVRLLAMANRELHDRLQKLEAEVERLMKLVTP